ERDPLLRRQWLVEDTGLSRRHVCRAAGPALAGPAHRLARSGRLGRTTSRVEVHRLSQMRLGVFVQTPGPHVAGWRHPDAATRGCPNLALMQHIAATAERGKFDMFFLGDGFATGYDEHPSTIGKFEPLTLLSALAMTTSRLGLTATGSTTYAEPYHVARGF